MARTTVKTLTTNVLDADLGGIPIPLLKKWFDFAKGQESVDATTGGGYTSITLNSEDITQSMLDLSLASGCEISNFPCFFKMTDAAFALNVPVGISNRSYIDDNEQEVVRSWSEWHDDLHLPRTGEGFNFVASNSFGAELTGAELLIIAALPDVDILTAASYLAVNLDEPA